MTDCPCNGVNAYQVSLLEWVTEGKTILTQKNLTKIPFPATIDR